jgi:hypothetical protein
MGDEYDVKANIEQINAFSAHADYEECTKWLKSIDTSRLKKIFMVHGEKDAQECKQDYFAALDPEAFPLCQHPCGKDGCGDAVTEEEHDQNRNSAVQKRFREKRIGPVRNPRDESGQIPSQPLFPDINILCQNLYLLKWGAKIQILSQTGCIFV